MADKNIFDTAEFSEIILAHLIRDKEVFLRAKELKMVSEDMLATTQFGIQMYKVFADIIFEINDTPIETMLFGIHIKQNFDQGLLNKAQADEIGALWSRVYELSLNKKYVLDNLQLFIKYRRQEKAKLESTTTDQLQQELNKIAVELRENITATQSRSIRPFETVVQKSFRNLMQTGFGDIDFIFGGGIGREEYYQIIGFSGGGKTALACGISLNMTKLGTNVCYLSIEEPAENVADRFYAQVFRIPYTALHSGTSQLELNQKFSEMDPAQKTLLSRMTIHDIRDLSPINTETIKAFLDKKAKEEGYYPDVVIIDQMDYMEPVKYNKQDQAWKSYEKIAFDCDNLSIHKINGTHNFALILLHQATGKLRRKFTNAEISGFKNIIKPADATIGIGRDNPTSDDFCLFSLKTRHSKGFELEYKGELEFMNFISKSHSK